MMRVVLDTNVLARAATGPPGLANQLVVSCTQQGNDVIVSPFLLSELSRVLRYDRVRSLHGLNDSEIDAYVGDLLAVATMVFPAADSPQVVLADKFDDAVVATAIAGRAEVLCSLDRHLFRPEVIKYCRAHGIQVLTDRQLLDQLLAQ